MALRPVSALARLPLRIALASTVCAGLATLFMVRALSVAQTRALIHRTVTSGAIDAHATRACAVGGRVELGTRETATLRVRAYDARGHALDGSAAPSVVAAVVRGRPRAESVSAWGFGGSVVAVRRRGAEARCAIASLEIVAGPARVRAAATLLALTLAASCAAVVLTALVVVRPLSRRLTRLADAAARIGDGADLGLPADEARDDVASIAEALRTSHARIASARAAEAASRRALDEHLRDVAHDLRTPVASLCLALERAQRESDRRAQDAALRDALRDAAYLGGLVANLELETRAKGHALRAVSIDLRETVSAAVARGRALGGATVEVDGAVPDEPVVRALDPVALERVISNLIENSVRHGARQVGVVLALEGPWYRVEVCDDGAGDPATMREGRGLAITRTLADAVGAELSLARTAEGLVARLRERPREV
jgi:signal transduction histidine kinase